MVRRQKGGMDEWVVIWKDKFNKTHDTVVKARNERLAKNIVIDSRKTLKKIILVK